MCSTIPYFEDKLAKTRSWNAQLLLGMYYCTLLDTRVTLFFENQPSHSIFDFHISPDFKSKFFPNLVAYIYCSSLSKFGSSLHGSGQPACRNAKIFVFFFLNGVLRAKVDFIKKIFFSQKMVFVLCQLMTSQQNFERLWLHEYATKFGKNLDLKLGDM